MPSLSIRPWVLKGRVEENDAVRDVFRKIVPATNEGRISVPVRDASLGSQAVPGNETRGSSESTGGWK